MTTTTMFIAPARHRHRHLYFCLYLYFTSTSVATLAQASQSEYVFPLPWSGMSGPYDEAFHEAFVPRHPGWAELGIRGWAEIGRDLAAEIDGKGKGKGTGKGWVYTWEQFEEDEGVLFLQLQRHMGTAGLAGAIARTISRVLWVYKGKGKGKDGTSNADDGGMIITGSDDNEESVGPSFGPCRHVESTGARASFFSPTRANARSAAALQAKAVGECVRGS